MCDVREPSREDGLIQRFYEADRNNEVEFCDVLAKEVCDEILSKAGNLDKVRTILFSLRHTAFVYALYKHLPEDLREYVHYQCATFIYDACGVDHPFFELTYTSINIAQNAFARDNVELATAILQLWRPTSISFSEVEELAKTIPTPMPPRDNLKSKLKVLLEVTRQQVVKEVPDVSFYTALRCAFGFNNRYTLLKLSVQLAAELGFNAR